MPAKTIYTIELINKRKSKESRLTAISFNGYTNRPKCGKISKLILCKCDCGKEVNIIIGNILNGTSLSCGCLKNELTIYRTQKYFPVNKTIYNSWHSMMGRCYEPNNGSYKDYGERGVRICDEWKNNYQSFLDWSLANGWAKGLQIDKDIKGNGLLYGPDTCMWVSPTLNANNTRKNKRYEFKGELYTMAQLSNLTNIPYKLLHRRITQYEIPIEEATSTTKRLHHLVSSRRMKIINKPE